MCWKMWKIPSDCTQKTTETPFSIWFHSFTYWFHYVYFILVPYEDIPLSTDISTSSNSSPPEPSGSKVGAKSSIKLPKPGSRGRSLRGKSQRTDSFYHFFMWLFNKQVHLKFDLIWEVSMFFVVMLQRLIRWVATLCSCVATPKG